MHMHTHMHMHMHMHMHHGSTYSTYSTYSPHQAPIKAQYLEWMDDLFAASSDEGGGTRGKVHNRLFYGDPAEEMGGGRAAERRRRREKLESIERLKESQLKGGLLKGGLPTSEREERATLPRLLCRPLTSTWREQLEELGGPADQTGTPSRPTTTQVRRPRMPRMPHGESSCCSGGLLSSMSSSMSSPSLPRLTDADAELLSLNDKPYRAGLNARRLNGSASKPELAPTMAVAGAGAPATGAEPSAAAGAAAEVQPLPEMGRPAAVQHSGRLRRLGSKSDTKLKSKSTPNLVPLKFVSNLRAPSPPKSMSGSSRNLLTKAGLDKKVGLRRGVDFRFDGDSDSDGDGDGVADPWNPSVEKIEILETKQSKGEKLGKKDTRRVGWHGQKETPPSFAVVVDAAPNHGERRQRSNTSSG